MDIDLQNRVNRAIEQLKSLSFNDIDLNEMDPIAKMLLVALIHEAQKIEDHVDSIDKRIAERFCSDFVPHDKANATPAIAILSPSFKPKKEAEYINIGTGAVFSYKTSQSKHPLNYIPLFSTVAIPHDHLFTVTKSQIRIDGNDTDNHMNLPNSVWLGITTPLEIDNLKGLSLLIKGTRGIAPSSIRVGASGTSLDFATLSQMESIEMAEPFDAQQSSGQFFSFVEIWKERLLNIDDAVLVYISDDTTDRDLFKPKAFPSSFRQELEDNKLSMFDPNTLWIELEFPNDYSITDHCEILLNAFPVVNVDVNTLTLTQATPIAKLQKQEDSFFLGIVETSSSSIHQGFNSMNQDIIIRDFDASRYHNGELLRDARNLYNHFIDDYYAFIEYNGIRDGEALKQLRQTINQIGKKVGDINSKFKFDSGTYVMKNMNQEQSSSTIKVNYMTTQGKLGNSPRAGETMENKKLLAFDQKIKIAVSATGGSDKASPDQMYELLRYYSLTNDRLYTKMDIDAFLRKEIISEFGREEFKRTIIKINIAGYGRKQSLQRALYIDIEFKDRKNYKKAVETAFDKQLLQKIENKSCISMPIFVQFHNLEDNGNA